jgi:hypothetical protein
MTGPLARQPWTALSAPRAPARRRQPLVEVPITVSAAFEGSEEIVKARDLAGLFLTDVQAVAVQVSVWDSGTAVSAVLAPDPSRIGRHGLEIVMAVCQSFAVRQEPVGKRITATVTRADDPGADAVGHEPM